MWRSTLIYQSGCDCIIGSFLGFRPSHGQTFHNPDKVRVADKPTGSYVDERGLSPSGGIRGPPENWVVGMSDSLIQMARSRLYRQGPIFGQARKLANALTTDIFDHMQEPGCCFSTFSLGDWSLPRRVRHTIQSQQCGASPCCPPIVAGPAAMRRAECEELSSVRAFRRLSE
jgi:hypothetical protein